jgi:hypothetical protein
MAGTERSPRYPGFPLGTAIQFAQSLYDKEKRGVVPPESVFRALGHDVMSGAAKVKIATMRQYGLLEDVGRGKVRLSDSAFTILMNPNSEQYREAVQSAAAAPQLFQKIKSAYPDGSAQTLKFYLMRDLKFSEDGAQRAIKSYRESQEFANLPPRSYNGENTSESSSEESDQADQGLQVFPTHGKVQGTTMLDSSQPSLEKRRVAYTWPLPDDTDAQVAFTQRPTRRGVERLIAYLQFMKDDLPSPEADVSRDKIIANEEGEDGETGEPL